MVAIAGYDMTMSTAPRMPRVSVEEYLAGEASSAIKHEYVDGRVYAMGATMAGGKASHNTVAMNVAGSLHSALKGHQCQAFGSDMKVRIRNDSDVRFYYPDVMVVCEANSLDDQYPDKPVVIVEVLSDSAKRLDTGEKQQAYLTIPSLTHYILLEADSPSVVVYQRSGEKFERSILTNLDEDVQLEALGLSLSLRDAYDRVLDD